MTETTDIAALMRDMRDLADRIVECQGENLDGEEITHLYDHSDTIFKAQNILLVLNAFQAERQRADKAEHELIKPLPIGELIQRLESQTHEKWFSQSDFRGEQEPAEYQIHDYAGLNCIVGTLAEAQATAEKHNGTIRPMWDAPPKPVVVLPSPSDLSTADDDVTGVLLAGMNMMLEYCRDAVISAGVSVKGGQ